MGHALFALGSPWGGLALVAPAIMIFLLLEVTGVRPTEEQALESRGDLYRDYQRRVSRLVPWPRAGVSGSSLAMRLLDTGCVPDVLIRRAIRRLLAQRLEEEGSGTLEARQERRRALLASLRESPLAIHTQAANAQHYELPAAFFERVLGPRLKYSSGYYGPGVTDLGAAEEAMLDLTIRRAGLEDGEDVLELGCGWGSLTLTMAERFPRSRITAVSNSHSQRSFILARAAARGLSNVEVITCDVNVLEFPESRRFDRAVSVEMFEHLRNYQQLFARIAAWLRPRGTLFVHIFTHRIPMVRPMPTAGGPTGACSSWPAPSCGVTRRAARGSFRTIASSAPEVPNEGLSVVQRSTLRPVRGVVHGEPVEDGDERGLFDTEQRRPQ